MFGAMLDEHSRKWSRSGISDPSAVRRRDWKNGITGVDARSICERQQHRRDGADPEIRMASGGRLSVHAAEWMGRLRFLVQVR